MCWCDPSLKIFVGVVGILLFLIGDTQIVVGIYFMLTLPIFSVSSNIWTGVVTGLAGIYFAYLGFTGQVKRRSYAIITVSLVALLLNLINLVIIQVGERSIFLTEEALRIISQDTKMLYFDIAIWSSTGLSAVALFSTFVVGQCLFCRHLDLTSKGTPVSSPHTLNYERRKSRAGSRFFPPSRVVLPKVDNNHPSHENGLWIPRNGSYSTLNEDTSRFSHSGGGGDGCNGSERGSRILGEQRPAEVVLGFEKCMAIRPQSLLCDSYGQLNTTTDEDNDQTKEEINYSNRLSTFKPKAKKRTTQIYNNDNDSKSQEMSKGEDKVYHVKQGNQTDESSEPLYEHNQKKPWMFLLPSVFAEVDGIEDGNKFVEERVSPVSICGTEQISFHNTHHLSNANTTSTERLINPSPRSRAKLKRPTETPPSPPNTYHNPVSRYETDEK